MREYIKLFPVFLIFLFGTSTESLAKAEVMENPSQDRHLLNLQEMIPDEKTPLESLDTPKNDEIMASGSSSLGLSMLFFTDETPAAGNLLGMASPMLALTDGTTAESPSEADSYMFLMREKFHNIYEHACNTVYGICNPENEPLIRNGAASCVSGLLLAFFGLPEANPVLPIMVRYTITDPLIDYLVIPAATTVWNYWGNNVTTAAVA